MVPKAARTGREQNRRGACVGLAERSERSQPARTGQRGVNTVVNQAICDVFSASESASERVMNE